MTLRTDLAPVVNDARQIVDDLGYRLYDVTIRTSTWPATVGRGTPVIVNTVITPRARVEREAPNFRYSQIGRFQEGDRFVRKINQTLTRAILEGPAGPLVETVYILTPVSEPAKAATYTLVGEPTQKPHEWQLHLRKKSGGPC